MPALESGVLNIGGFDRLAAQDTPIHRRDPRAKVITALLFIITVVSFRKYDLAALMPLFLYPAALIALGNLPPRFLLGKVLLATPFALIIGIFNPVLDRVILMHLGPVGISGGWISYASILLRFLLTLSAALILIATTGFNAICLALAHLKLPQPFTLQCLLLYRYIFVLGEEASRMFNAWRLRAVSNKRMPWTVFSTLIGQLLIRALDRAQRIHMAMLSRGFDGEMHVLRPLKFGLRDLLFVLGWSCFFLFARLCNLPQLLGQAVMGIGS